MKLFKRGYEVTLNRVHDRLVIREGNERLPLTVDGDAMRIVAGLEEAQKRLKMLIADGKEPEENEMRDTAEVFAAVMFGKEQTEKLFDFYANDPACIINVCTKYFGERLSGLIAKVQKRAKA